MRRRGALKVNDVGLSGGIGGAGDVPHPRSAIHGIQKVDCVVLLHASAFFFSLHQSAGDIFLKKSLFGVKGFWI